MKRLWALVCLLVFLMNALPAAAQEENVVISEVMASNGVYENGHSYDWVELYNPGSAPFSLRGCFLSDNPEKPKKWQFPDEARIPARGYLVVYCAGKEDMPPKNGSYFASFKLSSSGDEVVLTRENGSLISYFSFPKQYGNISFGVTQEGQTGFFRNATPGEKNEKTVYALRASSPVLETPAGFYQEKLTVRSQAAAGDTLRYTLNGNTPDEEDKVFPKEGITVDKTTVLRLRAFHENKLPSETISATYFVNDPSPVAVVSLTTDEKYFSGRYGALVKGSGSTPNYEKEYEYPVNIEYFDESGSSLINQMGTFTASGHSARQNSQKSIALYARKAYGKDSFQFNPFPHRNYREYKSILLRSTNSDAFSTRLRDAVFSSLAEKLDILYQDARPIVVYLNGEYWGHYNLREKINKYFVAQWEGIEDEKDIDNIDILARTGSDRFVQNGHNEDWLELCDFCKTKDLNDPENLRFVTDRLDVDSLFTHAAFEIIIGNGDITNVRMYRVPQGKWKYLLFDVEAGFLSLDPAPLENYIKDVDRKIQAFRHEPLNALLQVPEMKDRFLKRFAQILETSFLWPDVEEKFEPWENILEQLLPRQNERWPYLTMKKWRQNVDAVKYYARVRPRKIVSMLAKRMQLTETEVNTYFGDVQKLLDEQNARPQ